MLVEINGCVFLAEELRHSHGYERLDDIGKEAFVNHVHIEGNGHRPKSDAWVKRVSEALRQGWPGQRFRIYRQSEKRETIMRFHKVRESKPNWCESGVEIIEVIT